MNLRSLLRHGSSRFDIRLLSFLLAIPASTSVAAELKVAKPPKGYSEKYTKYVSADGFPVLGSAKVNDYAMLEAAYLINKMLGPRPDVRKSMIENSCRFVVMAVDEMTTDVPEHATLTPKDYYDRRGRGLGPTPQRPAVSCGEENLLKFPGDPYPTESILVHEFAHAIHLMGLRFVEPKFDLRLKDVYDQAMSAELWKGKYAAKNKEEYWAEGVQSYFDTNRPPDHDHNDVRTREGLKKYDPRLHSLIDAIFKETEWRYVKPADRKEKEHLAGYDPKTAKRFAWPKGLEKPIPKTKN